MEHLRQSTPKDAYGVSPKRCIAKRAPGLKNSTCLVGVEIEGEDINLHEYPPQSPMFWERWSAVPGADGSLRGPAPVEWVLKAPLRGDQLLKALACMTRYLSKTPIQFPYRTSTHIHINVSDRTFHEILCIVYLSILYEELLFNFCAPHRQSNPFCLPWSIDYIKKAQHFFKHPSVNQNVYLDYGEKIYAGCSLYPINSKGSIEYRYLEGTKSYKKLKTWINILLSIYNRGLRIAEEGDVPDTIINHLCQLSGNGPEKDIQTTFGIVLGRILCSPDKPYDYLSNMRKAQSFIGGLLNVRNKRSGKIFQI